MYHLEGKRRIESQVHELVQAACGEGAKLCRSSYLDFIGYVLPESPKPRLDQGVFLYDEAQIRELVSHFTTEDLLTDLGAEILPTPKASMVAGLNEVKKALELMEKLDPELHQIFSDYIHTLFYHRSEDSGGGSVSSLVGVIWCCNRQDWSTWDVLEFLVHELTHNLVFLDEYYHVHYQDLAKVGQRENYALSAVLKTMRPLDKVFHSLVVGYEVLELRRRFNDPVDPKAHPPTQILIQQCLQTVESLKQIFALKPELATRRVINTTLKIEARLLTRESRDFEKAMFV